MLVTLASLAACSDDHCAEEASGATSAPVLEAFDLLEQLEGDPWTLIFAATFSDADGDLAAGHAELSVNGRASGNQLPLGDIFRQSGLPASARSGRIAFPLRFEDTVEDGAQVWLGMQLVDGARQRSNCAALELGFAVEPVAGLWQRLRRGLAAWWGEDGKGAS
jgi:hypothetical protein